jgi:hypothetical protein
MAPLFGHKTRERLNIPQTCCLRTSVARHGRGYTKQIADAYLVIPVVDNDLITPHTGVCRT